jgi:Peptidase family M48
VRRTLLLGVPLLKVLQEDEVKAVIAHELGHLSRQHGRLGHWIYRVRAKWETESYNAPDGGTVDNLLRALSDWISPAFIRRSAEWSVHCEYEADQSAANAGFAKPLARALVKLDALFELLQYKFRRSLSEANLRGDAPPTDYWATLLATARQHADASFIAQTIASGKTRKSGAHQISHPPTADRVAHLGVHLPEIEWDKATCAGDALLGSDWSSIYEKCATQEQESLAEYWSIHHYHLRANEMIANNSLLPAQDDDVDGREVRQLTARDVIEETDATLQSLRQHADSNPKSARALYEYGAALLRRERVDGVDFIRSAYRVDRAYAPQGSSLIHNFLHRFGTHQEAMSAWRTYQNAIEWVERFTDDLWARLLSSPLLAAPNAVAQLLNSALKDRAELDACWLVSLDSRQVVNRTLRINVLVLRVSPQPYSASGKNEDALVSNVVSLARGLFTPDELIRTMVFYTTEPIDPKLYTRLTAIQGATIIAPTKPVNENFIKIDSL